MQRCQLFLASIAVAKRSQQEWLRNSTNRAFGAKQPPAEANLKSRLVLHPPDVSL
jgi:hypothetical protein